MATIVDAPVSDAPVDFSQDDIITETQGEFVDLPVYSQEIGQEIGQEINATSYYKKQPHDRDRGRDGRQVKSPPVKGSKGGFLHPIFPSNDIFENVRTHLKCQELFTQNMHALIAQFLINKQDLEKARDELSEARSDLREARRENDRLQQGWDDAVEQLIFIREDLQQTRISLDSAVKQLAETASKLEKANDDLKAIRSDLKSARSDLNNARKQIKGLEDDLKFFKNRVQSLEEELRRANHGENLANDRNTELTALLYRAQAEKAQIERQKDQLTADVHEYKKMLNEHK